MNRRAASELFRKELSNLYPREEIQSIFFLLCEKYLALSKVQLMVDMDAELREEQSALFLAALGRLKEQEPVQYILGEEEFFGLNFFVNKHVLIPRPETEELVVWAIEDIKKIHPFGKDVSVLDIGTGSGCIGIALKKELEYSTISVLDVSEDALAVAAQNADYHHLKINFISADILQYERDEKWNDANARWDVLISNPPYIRSSEMAEMHPNVLRYEPHLALFVADDDPLLFYKAILQFAKKHVKKNGFVYFEIHEDHADSLSDFARTSGYKEIDLRIDLNGKDRMMRLRVTE